MYKNFEKEAVLEKNNVIISFRSPSRFGTYINVDFRSPFYRNLWPANLSSDAYRPKSYQHNIASFNINLCYRLVIFP